MSTPRQPSLFHFPRIPYERSRAHYLEASRMVAAARAAAKAKNEPEPETTESTQPAGGTA